jgi:hypothetical protein
MRLRGCGHWLEDTARPDQLDCRRLSTKPNKNVFLDASESTRAPRRVAARGLSVQTTRTARLGRAPRRRVCRHVSVTRRIGTTAPLNIPQSYLYCNVAVIITPVANMQGNNLRPPLAQGRGTAAA